MPSFRLCLIDSQMNIPVIVVFTKYDMRLVNEQDVHGEGHQKQTRPKIERNAENIISIIESGTSNKYQLSTAEVCHLPLRYVGDQVSYL